MDLSEFEKNPNMRITVWVNELIKGIDRDRLEVRLSVVTGHLQARIDEICDSLDGSMAKLVFGIPRANDEVERLELSLEALASELAALEDVANGGHAESDTADVQVEILCRLDTAKERMHGCITTLREAREWDALVRDIRSRLSQGDLAGVVEKLVALDKSRQPLEYMPGGCERTATIKELRLELEKQLLPCVRAAMEKNMSSIAGGEPSSYVPLSELVAMCEKLGKTDMLCHEYAKARTPQLHQLWYNYISQPENAMNNKQIPRWLAGFYNKVQTLLAEEYKYAGAVFGTNRAASVFLSFVNEAMGPIESSLVELLRKTTWPDAVGLQSVALSTAGSALFVAKGLSQSERIKLLQCFSTPFDRLAQEFGTIELGFLKEELHSDLLTLRSLLVVDDIPTVLFTNPEKMFAPRLREIVCAARRALQDANEALSHCLTLTSGIRTTELLDILCKVLGEVMDLAKSATDQSRSICGPLRGDNCCSSTADDDGRGGEVFGWEFLSTALEYLSSAGGIHRSLAELEQSIAQNIGEACSALLDFPPQALEVALTPVEESGRSVLDNLHRALGKVRLEQGGDELHSMLNSTLDTLGTAEFLGEVLPLPVKYMKSFIVSARQLVYDISMAVIHHSMKNVSNLPDWDAEFGTIDECYGVPHAFMTATGEHLLSLLQQLEPFARSSSFADAALTIEKGGTTKLAIPQWKTFGRALGFPDENLVVGLSDVASGAAYTFITSYDNNDDSDEATAADQTQTRIEDGGVNDEEEDDDESERDVLCFCRDWLLAIGGGAVGAFLCEIAKVKKFSSLGAAQLAADCAYLGNVLHALDLQPHPLLWWMESVVNQHLKKMDSTGQHSKTGAPLKLIKSETESGKTVGTSTLACTLIAKLDEQVHAALP